MWCLGTIQGMAWVRGWFSVVVRTGLYLWPSGLAAGNKKLGHRKALAFVWLSFASEYPPYILGFGL